MNGDNSFLLVLSGEGGLNSGHRFFGPYDTFTEAAKAGRAAKEKFEVVSLHPAFNLDKEKGGK